MEIDTFLGIYSDEAMYECLKPDYLHREDISSYIKEEYLNTKNKEEALLRK
jgi:hypothetical protein